MIANLSAFQMANPVAHPNPDDFEPDGTWYSMVAVRSLRHRTQSWRDRQDHNQRPDQPSDRHLSKSGPYRVPTAIAYHGNFYVGNLDTFDPSTPPGASKIYKVTPSGQIKIDTNGLALITEAVFDNRARMYVLQLGTDPATFAPGTGQIVRVDPSGTLQVIVTQPSPSARIRSLPWRSNTSTPMDPGSCGSTATPAAVTPVFDVIQDALAIALNRYERLGAKLVRPRHHHLPRSAEAASLT